MFFWSSAPFTSLPKSNTSQQNAHPFKKHHPTFSIQTHPAPPFSCWPVSPVSRLLTSSPVARVGEKEDPHLGAEEPRGSGEERRVGRVELSLGDESGRLPASSFSLATRLKVEELSCLFCLISIWLQNQQFVGGCLCLFWKQMYLWRWFCIKLIWLWAMLSSIAFICFLPGQCWTLRVGRPERIQKNKQVHDGKGAVLVWFRKFSSAWPLWLITNIRFPIGSHSCSPTPNPEIPPAKNGVFG